MELQQKGVAAYTDPLIKGWLIDQCESNKRARVFVQMNSRNSVDEFICNLLCVKDHRLKVRFSRNVDKANSNEHNWPQPANMVDMTMNFNLEKLVNVIPYN